MSQFGCVPGHKNYFFLVLSYDVHFFFGSFEADFGLSSGRVLCHVNGRIVDSIGAGLLPSERVVSGMNSSRKK